MFKTIITLSSSPFIDISERIFSTSDFGTQTQVKESEIKKTPFKVPWINFGHLWKEFKNVQPENVKSNHQEPTQNLNTIDRFRLYR